MASLRQKKKQNSAKRAWKSLTNMVKSKFRDMEIASSLRESTARVLRFISRRIIVPFRTRYLQNNRYTDKYYYGRNESSRQFLNFISRPPIKPKSRSYGYDDDYSQIYHYQSSQTRNEGMTSKTTKEKVVVVRKEEKVEEDDDDGMPEIADSMEDAWKRVVAASPHLQVNERADEFIYKFRESMKMEKERSFLEFQERLKRSA